MSVEGDLYDALHKLKRWADAIMDDSRPNSDRYENAKHDRDFADRKLREHRL